MIDVIGVIRYPARVNEKGIKIAAAVTKTGYHVNSVVPIADWEENRVYPKTPDRVFFGVPIEDTFFYKFFDKNEFDLKDVRPKKDLVVGP